jgi:hypothetical protein
MIAVARLFKPKRFVFTVMFALSATFPMNPLTTGALSVAKH